MTVATLGLTAAAALASELAVALLAVAGLLVDGCEPPRRGRTLWPPA
jgi:hypothetical protein